MQKFFHLFADNALAFLAGLTPAALGAAVSLAYEKGLTWTERFVQMAVGVIVSFFVSRAADAVWPLDPFVLQAVGFVTGMIAYKATPRFTGAAAEATEAVEATGAATEAAEATETTEAAAVAPAETTSTDETPKED